MTAVSQLTNSSSASVRGDIVSPAGDPQIGNLATPINASPVVLTWIKQLPIYRPGLTPFRRGLEVGMAHGYWLLGPFMSLGPFRSAGLANLSGLLATMLLVLIAAATLWLYGSSQPSAAILATVTPAPPPEFRTQVGWTRYAGGFLVGGVGGALFGYVILGLVALFKVFF